MKKGLINVKKILVVFMLLIMISLIATGCNQSNNNSNSEDPKTDDNDNEVVEIDFDKEKHNYVLKSEKDGTFKYVCADCKKSIELSINTVSGTINSYKLDENTLTFDNINEDSVYEITGEFYGNIIIDISEDYNFELILKGVKLYSYSECPINIISGNKVTISAKKNTDNYIFDMRDEVETDDIAASLYSKCDLNVQGKGKLYVKSINNNGIHTKDDLKVKNLYLQVECINNALKGNDSVTIESGDLVLISRRGDGIKTTSSDVSSKGNQKGTISILGGNISIYSACDGIDSSYDVVINESIANVSINIYTDKYSEYSEEVVSIVDKYYYVRFNSISYKYSLKYYNDDSDFKWVSSSTYKRVGNSYYYQLPKEGNYHYMKLYIYSSVQNQGQEEEYVFCSEEMSMNNNYDTISLQIRGSRISYSWTNYSTSMVPGHGGMEQGNIEKGDHSTKGIKADNKIEISSGKINIKSYDDSIHANNTVLLNNNDSALGDVNITGGEITLYSNDDGIHSDGNVYISGGTISVLHSYEGVEGKQVNVSGGDISIVSSDDGINGTATSGEGIVISGGKLYVYAGGDGLDSNSRTSYEGILFAGGNAVIISTGRADSSIDTERGYKYTGGNIIALGVSGGMSRESTMCSPSITSIGKTANINLEKNNYFVVEGVLTIKMPVELNSFVVCLGEKMVNAKISSATRSDKTLDANGVCWEK